jgi:hypothetical protein
MQKAIKRFLSQTKILRRLTPDAVAQLVLDYWLAIAVVLRESWDNPRSNLLNKGIGVYALMTIASDLYLESIGQSCDKRYFTAKLAEFVSEIDWSTQGSLKGLGGEGGVNSVVGIIRETRKKPHLRVVTNGK